jgi:hypothetical protein
MPYRPAGEVSLSSQLTSPSATADSGAIGQIYDVSVSIAAIHQVAAAKDAVMIFSFSLPVPLPVGTNINIWVPANYISSTTQARPYALFARCVSHALCS